MTKPFFPHDEGHSTPPPDKAREVLRRLRQAAEESRAEQGQAGRPAAAAGAGHANVEEMIFGKQGQKKRSALPVLAAIFVISALAGGGLAGVFLSLRANPHPPRVLVQRENQTLVRARGQDSRARAGAASQGALEVKGDGEKDVARIERARPQTPARVTRPARTADAIKTQGSLPPAPPFAAVKVTPAAGAAVAQKAPGGRAAVVVESKPAAVAPKRVEPATMDQGGMATDRKSLEALTDGVVRALGGVHETENAQSTDNLRQALSQLVMRAFSEGRSQDEIARLLARRLEGNAQAVPEALKGPDGKVDIRLLIASVLPRDASTYAGRKDRTLAMLIAEGEKVTLSSDARPARSRFYKRGGKRYTRIRRGDTLSQIAFAAYGDVLAYPAILQANGGRVSVRNLKPGMEILIPAREGGATAQPRRAKTGKRSEGKHSAAQAPTRTTRKARAGNRKRIRRKRAASRRKGPRKITDRLLGAISAPTPASQPSAAQDPVRPTTTNFTTHRP